MSMNSDLGAIISGVGGGALGYLASSKAADAQKQANLQAMVMQWKMYQQSRQDFAPWREAGSEAVNKLSEIVNQGPGKFVESPGYEFRLKEGQRAIEGSAAARGSVLSGAAQKAALRYGQDYATNDYDNFLARYYQSLTPYQSLAGLDMTATRGTVNANANAANYMGQYLQNMGNAQATGYINQANSIAGGINSGINNALARYNAWRNFDGSVLPYSNYSDYAGGDTGSFSTPSEFLGSGMMVA